MPLAKSIYISVFVRVYVRISKCLYVIDQHASSAKYQSISKSRCQGELVRVYLFVSVCVCMQASAFLNIYCRLCFKMLTNRQFDAYSSNVVVVVIVIVIYFDVYVKLLAFICLHTVCFG